MNNERIICYEETAAPKASEPKGRAIASLILGILSIIASGSGLLGLILGAVACKLAKPIPLTFGGTVSSKLAKAGKATGSIGSVLSVVAMILTFVVIVLAVTLVILYVVPVANF